ncbi:divalent-cation tolerance protein CutA [Candidatus Saccharibacteria bacterium]|nr:divalent-cation tolerance protein CutA [Candidatus Saccharibacteria bacterium]MCB9834494.1 divalent-cation tolerance protein CutA [Candidatus Nomurabacteria bacterium]
MQPILIRLLCNDDNQASQIIKLLLEQDLIASAQKSSVQSYYHINNSVQYKPEIKLEMLSVSNRFKAIEQIIIENHSYNTPSLTAILIDKNNTSLLDWIRESL